VALADDILAALREHPEGLGDGELARRFGKFHAHVYQVCEQLAARGRIVRDKSTRPLVNRLSDGARVPSAPQPSEVPTVDVADNVAAYLGDRNPESRYASFDYCFNYFRGFHERGRAATLTNAEHLEKASLHLGFYLASWGMLRGSSDLLQRSVRYFSRLIEEIAASPPELWDLDVAGYDPAGVDLLMESRRRLRTAFLEPPSDTLITKLLLGVFGCVPAFDRYFRAGLGVATFGRSSLQRMRAFYDVHAEAVEAGRVATIDFATGDPTSRRYTAAKVIDMVFFMEGMRKLGSAPVSD
jgi:hypothetical protein